MMRTEHMLQTLADCSPDFLLPSGEMRNRDWACQALLDCCGECDWTNIEEGIVVYHAVYSNCQVFALGGHSEASCAKVIADLLLAIHFTRRPTPPAEGRWTGLTDCAGSFGGAHGLL